MWPDVGLSVSNSSICERPSHILRVTEVPSNSTQVVEPVKGCTNFLRWIFQAPNSKSKSCWPSRSLPAGLRGAAACTGDAIRYCQGCARSVKSVAPGCAETRLLCSRTKAAHSPAKIEMVLSVLVMFPLRGARVLNTSKVQCRVVCPNIHFRVIRYGHSRQIQRCCNETNFFQLLAARCARLPRQEADVPATLRVVPARHPRRPVAARATRAVDQKSRDGIKSFADSRFQRLRTTPGRRLLRNFCGRRHLCRAFDSRRCGKAGGRGSAYRRNANGAANHQT